MTEHSPASDRERSADASQRQFFPALEGTRALAALGVIVTHVAFQTSTTSIPVLGRMLGRFDLAVAVFFGLSGFLLWRPHAAAARGLRSSPRARTYFLNRAARILPAYWVVVCVVLLLLPQAGGGLRVWFANLTLVQVFMPLTLTQGMTQMWSLSVEVAFYLLLPLLAWGVHALRGPSARWRIPVIAGVATLSLGWAFLPVHAAAGTSIQNWLPGYLPWFAAGMVVAEMSAAAAVRPSAVPRFVTRQWPMLGIAVIAFAASSTDLAGPEGLVTPQTWQYAVKIALGAVIAFALLAPLVFATNRHVLLEHPVVLTLGRWSYGIFVWHLAVLAIVFPVFGIVPFNGHFALVFVVTVVLSILVASASYALVEEPVRVAMKRWEKRRDERGSAATPTQTTATNAAN